MGRVYRLWCPRPSIGPSPPLPMRQERQSAEAAANSSHLICLCHIRKVAPSISMLHDPVSWRTGWRPNAWAGVLANDSVPESSNTDEIEKEDSWIVRSRSIPRFRIRTRERSRVPHHEVGQPSSRPSPTFNCDDSAPLRLCVEMRWFDGSPPLPLSVSALVAFERRLRDRLAHPTRHHNSSDELFRRIALLRDFP